MVDDEWWTDWWFPAAEGGTRPKDQVTLRFIRISEEGVVILGIGWASTAAETDQRRQGDWSTERTSEDVGTDDR